jgi:protocatechuate 3,4-dioxygenase alpha subunit
MLTGRVYDGNGQPVEDAMLEIWQADADGRYAHPADDARGKRADDRFRGFGRTGTTSRGEFTFQTIKPGAVPGPGNRQQAPHLNLILFSRGLLTHAFTRIYFSDERKANDLDPILNLIEPARRGTVIAQRDKDAAHPTYWIDIHLQGDNETVFLEA